MNDFRVKIGDTRCGVRATALIVNNRCLLVTRDDRGVYYTIGGGVAVNEISSDSLQREVKEEVGGDIKSSQLAFIVENFFTHNEDNFHNVEFHYLVELANNPQMRMNENGTIQQCEWVDFDHLAEIDLRPSFLKDKLPKWQQLEHIINEGV